MDYSRLTKFAAPAFFLAVGAGLSLLFTTKRVLEEIQTCVLQGKRLTLLKGEASLSTAGTLIIPNTPGLTCDTHIARLVLRAAGPALDQECHNWVVKFGQLIPGECATTAAGHLKVSSVIHIVPPASLELRALRETLSNALTTAGVGIAATRVAITEVGWKREMQAEDYARILVEECKKTLAKTGVAEIEIVTRESQLIPAIQALLVDSSRD